MTINVSGRTVNRGMSIIIGVEDDHLVADIVFTGIPELSPAQLTTLHWVAEMGGADNVGDIVALTRAETGWRFDVTNTLTQYADRPISAYLQVQAGDRVWHSQSFRLSLSALPDADTTATPPDPTIIDQMLAAIQAHNVAMAEHTTEMDGVLAEAQAARDEAQEARTDVADLAQGVEANREATTAAMERAEDAAEAADDSEQSAGVSATIAGQSLSDLLAMLSTQVATLGPDGKLTPGQIPPISINDVFPVASTAEMITLTAERGDTALIVADGVVTDSYILMTDDPTELTNWAKLGVSYVANAGHAMTADSTTDAERINGKRIISMTQAQYDTAEAGGALDPDTLYIVTP